MSFNIEKLIQVAKPVLEQVKKEAEFKKENKEWLRKSASIALAVRRELRLQGLSQQDLALKMGLSPQYIGRILKGQENLTLETISKLENAIGRSLLSIDFDGQLDSGSSQTYNICFPSSGDDAWIQLINRLTHKDKQAISQS